MRETYHQYIFGSSVDEIGYIRMRHKQPTFMKQILGSLLHGFGMLLSAFAIGTAASAVVCLWYGLPLALSLIGGFIVLGLALALMSESPFF